MDVRKARASDIEAAVALAERSRRQYQKYQPAFWHKAEKSAAVTQTFFTRLLAENDAFFLVAIEADQLLGFLIARKFTAPPVFEPGGDTYLIDDFSVLEPPSLADDRRSPALPRIDADPRAWRGPDRGDERRPGPRQDRDAAPIGPDHRLQLVGEAIEVKGLA